MMDSEKYLGIYKTRRQGNSVTVTIPKEANINAGTELAVTQTSAGIIYVPIKPTKKTNRYATQAAKNHNYQQDIDDLGYDPNTQPPVGSERINDSW
ncbi:hypothetical protein ACLHK8_05165 [Pediococcus sp. M21F004]|uniref:AbrB/MazE/SpoVT family DNA-binding domain-containing protein n=1 Tax=Pediococcus sp. M21F004 TaxID=3390033 RepID=UPI003DA71C34